MASWKVKEVYTTSVSETVCTVNYTGKCEAFSSVLLGYGCCPIFVILLHKEEIKLSKSGKNSDFIIVQIMN